MGVDQGPKLAVTAASEDSDHEVYDAPRSVSRLSRWFRSPLFNVIIVGLISFTQPGIWNRLNNTGAGGQQEPYLANGANSLTFGYATTYIVSGYSLVRVADNDKTGSWYLAARSLSWQTNSVSRES
jgi:hypothetical protein